MRFLPTSIDGVKLIELDAVEDERGFFARSYCEAEFADAGVKFQPRQMNISHNRHALTLRGLHYQAEPHAESKLVQCVRGRVFDVAVDLRPRSSTYKRWTGVELSAGSPRLLFIPEGCAHGFLTLEADSGLVYVMGTAFVPESGRGVRWDDPAFAIEWPAVPRIISPRDAHFPDFVGLQ